MIAIDAKTLGPDHPSMARDLTGLAYVYLMQKKYDDAKTLVNRALKIYNGAYGSDPLVVKRIELLLKLIDGRQHSDPENQRGKDYLETLAPIPLQAQKLEIALQLNYLGLLCYSEGKVEDAEKIYAWALAATALSSGEQSMLAGACLNDYARVLRSSGNPPKAKECEQDADSNFTRALMRQAAVSMP
jgi:tetratricopeptide (TPR) repeat protein